jgi:hypothetical protein
MNFVVIVFLASAVVRHGRAALLRTMDRRPSAMDGERVPLRIPRTRDKADASESARAGDMPVAIV